SGTGVATGRHDTGVRRQRAGDRRLERRVQRLVRRALPVRSRHSRACARAGIGPPLPSGRTGARLPGRALRGPLPQRAGRKRGRDRRSRRGSLGAWPRPRPRAPALGDPLLRRAGRRARHAARGWRERVGARALPLRGVRRDAHPRPLGARGAIRSPGLAQRPGNSKRCRHHTLTGRPPSSAGWNVIERAHAIAAATSAVSALPPAQRASVTSPASLTRTSRSTAPARVPRGGGRTRRAAERRIGGLSAGSMGSAVGAVVSGGGASGAAEGSGAAMAAGRAIATPPKPPPGGGGRGGRGGMGGGRAAETFTPRGGAGAGPRA